MVANIILHCTNALNLPIIAPTSLIHTAEREDAVDFTSPLEFSHKGVFIKNPINVNNWTAYLEPLTNLSWAVITVFYLLAPCALFIISRLSREENKLTLLQSYEAVLVALLLLSSPTCPNKMSTWIVFFR